MLVFLAWAVYLVGGYFLFVYAGVQKWYDRPRGWKFWSLFLVCGPIVWLWIGATIVERGGEAMDLWG